MKRVIIAGIAVAFVLATTGCASGAGDNDIIGGADAPTAIAIEPSDDAETVSEALTDDAILKAVANYCSTVNPDLKEIIENGEYDAYFEIESTDDNQVVVLYRSYTAAIVRYYVDRATGHTYVTEFVSGITPEEERTEESFNVNDYIQ